MARPHRTDAPGAVHHVMIRGVDGRAIFSCDSDREGFLIRFALLVRELGFLVLAWCLLGNHAHFVLQTGPRLLADLMARLNSRHAQRFNRRSNRKGHLFQDRYKAVLIIDDATLARNVAYALGNPRRHALMSMRGLEVYPYSGYGALVGSRLPRSFESPELVARALGVARERIRDFVEASALEAGSRSAALEPDQVAELNLLIRDCCRRHGVDESALRLPRASSRAIRAEVCALATDSLDIRLKEVSNRIGISYRTAKRTTAREGVE